MKEKINENILNFLDKKKKELISIMNKMGIFDGTYIIKNDYSVNLNGNIKIRDEISKVCPIKFDTCNGNFTWSQSSLDSLENMPVTINGDFDISYNYLKNLKNGPTHVKGSYNCSRNNLINLIGAPKITTGNFDASYCGLKSLEGSPATINGNFFVTGNGLTTLKGGPLYVTGVFVVNNNKLKSMESMPFCKDVSYDNNPLEKIKKEDEQLKIPFEDYYEIGDKVKYYRDGSPYNEMIGEVTIIKNKDNKKIYGVKFLDVIDKDKKFNKEVTVINVDPKRLVKKDSGEKNKINNEIEVGDKVLVDYPIGMVNPDKKIFIGEVESLDEYGVALVKYKENNKWYSHISNMKIKSKAEEIVIHEEPLFDYIIGDKIIYVDPKMKPQFVLYDGCEGIISSKELDNKGVYVYGIKLTDKNGIIRNLVNIYNERLRPKNEETKKAESIKFEINDKIIYTNPDFPNNTGCFGTITKVLPNDFYDIRLTNKDNIIKYMTNVPYFRLSATTKETPNIIFKKGDKVIFKQTKQPGTIVLDRSILLSNGKEVMSYDIEINYPNGGFIRRYNLRSEDLEKIEKDDFKINDKVVYLDPGGFYDECKGVVYATYGEHDDEVGVKITRDNTTISLPRVKKINLELADNYKEEIPKQKTENKYKKGDKIIYKGDRENGKLVGLSGIVNLVNTNYYSTNNTLDLLLFTKDGKEKLLYNVISSSIEPSVDEFEIGEKIKYNNPNDKELNNLKGIVKSVKNVDGKKIYKILFNVNDKLINLTNVDQLSMYKYIPNDDIYINDDVTYTKIDSKFYGCVGIVKDYSIDEDTYHLELTSKDNRKVTIKKTKLENIEKKSEKDYFKIGDKVKYISSYSNNIHSGSIGKIIKKFSDYYYDIEIITASGTKVSISAPRDSLSLVNEKEKESRFKFNDHVLYKKDDSKYNNRIGEYQRVREDGKYEIKFYNSYSDFNRVYVDNEYLEPYDGEIPEKKTSYSTTTKKKKKEKPQPLKPILVYNRRPVAIKMGKKKIDEPKKEEKKPIIGLDEEEYEDGQ